MRHNFQLLANAHVEKILTQKDGGPTQAVGVQTTLNGESRIILATKEVILAAGIFQSPKLLELSGIGNKELLKKQGIDVVEYLPGVGENLHDHAIVCTGRMAADDVATLDALIA
ncbi:putative glucose-methanol-choline oxidoreductase [Diaporthe ampelina]|uniref:Putative glucose-methanol-choline oxidoreductase n=1 Tax=Diaporthe ampelina TaxID=1214573 RepID=A0A0G2H3C8_9PEZI|nr:putative glucose-methanol-choline oxidoreductase [Diaporthe ampelina]